MKKLFACFAIAVLSMSFQVASPTVYHYPDFMIRYDSKIPANAKPATEGFSHGVFVAECNDYISDLDSVAIKYILDGQTVYTNFYSRVGETKQWKKYNADKKLISTILESRSDTAILGMQNEKWSVVYYKVE